MEAEMSETKKRESFGRAEITRDGRYTWKPAEGVSLPEITVNVQGIRSLHDGQYVYELAARGVAAICQTAVQTGKSAAEKYEMLKEQVRDIERGEWHAGEREGGFRFNPLLVEALMFLKGYDEATVREKLRIGREKDKDYTTKLELDKNVAGKIAQLIRDRAKAATVDATVSVEAF